MKNKLSANDMNLIQRFLDFELSESELDIFDQKFKTDAVFKEHVEMFQRADILTNQLKKETEAGPQEKKSTTTNPPPSNSFKRILFLLSAILMALIAFYFFSPFNEQVNEEKVYAEVSQYVDKISESAMRGEDSLKINSPDYTHFSIDRIKGVEDDVKELEKLLSETSNTNTREIILWTMVKVNFKNGNLTAGKEVLKKISQNNDFNSHKKAKEILMQL